MPSDLSWERVGHLEQKLQGPLLAEERPVLLKEARERRARLEVEDEEAAAEAVYRLRQTLFGGDSDRVILERRKTTAIPADVVREARDMIASHQLKQRTREWNGEAEEVAPSVRALSGGVSGAASATHFPKIAPDSADAPAILNLREAETQERAAKEAATATRRRKIALARAKTTAAKQVLQSMTDADIDAALPEPTREQSGVRLIPKKNVPPPTPVKLPSMDSAHRQ